MINNSINLENEKLRKFEINLNPNLRVDINNLLFKDFCHSNQFAYISVDKIFRTISSFNILEFKYINQLFNIKIPKEMTEELWHFSQPLQHSSEKNIFQFNFLIVELNQFCSVERGYYQMNKNKIHINTFAWVDIINENKLPNIKLSKIVIPKVAVLEFYIDINFPADYKINYEKKSISEYSLF